MGSMAPVFVDPAAAATNSGRRPAATSASIVAASASGRILKCSSVGSTRTCSGRKPRARAARATEEWAWSEQYATTSATIGPINDSLAHASAVMLAAEPPPRSTPAAAAG